MGINAQTSVSKMDAFILEHVDKGDFMGTVLVAHKGKVIFSKAYGFADYELKILNKVNTPFLIGSTTKSFTAVTIMQLVDQGLIDVQQKVSAYLPSLNKPLGDKLTVHHLLKMTSGLPGHLARLTDIEDRIISTSEIVEIIGQAELSFEPGTEYSYSNLNYHLLAAIIESVTGKSYSQVLKELTFEALDMKTSGTEWVDHPVKSLAVGYDSRDGEIYIKARPNYTSFALGSGDMYSTVEDLLKWDKALYGDKYLSGSSKEQIFNGADEDFGHYGYGFRVIDYKKQDSKNSGTLVRHGGSMIGYLANVHRYLDDQITVIVLSNLRPSPIRDITFGLKEIFFGRKPRPRDYE
jgi:CubicO group peptidase (beta-lactamase class C family)